MPTTPAKVLGYSSAEGQLVSEPVVVSTQAVSQPMVMPTPQVVQYQSMPAYSQPAVQYGYSPSPYSLPVFTAETPLTAPCTFEFKVEEKKEETDEQAKKVKK